ncbi:MAG: ribonuclease D [Bauldia sp.]
MHVITTTRELAAAVSRLAKFDVVTIDTEFMRETTYWPILCVVQLASPDEAIIVDALAPDLDLQPFFGLMADERVLKVFHAARQDIEIIYHLSGLIPHPIFDTQVAAMVCGFGESVSYDQLVQRLTGARIDKSSRFTDWSRRPLSDRQLAYAAADVTHLRDVYAALRDRLRMQNRAEWVMKEMDVLSSVDTYRTEPDEVWRRLKMRVKKPVELAVLKEVAAWREREAQARDVPRGRVLKDDGIFEIATQQPATAEALAELRTIPRGFERSRAGEEIVNAVKRALSIPKEKLPRIPKPRPAGEGNGAAVDLLKVLLKMVSEAHGVAAKVIASVDDLEALAGDDYADVPALQGWRLELFGEKALRLKRGQLALAVKGGQVIVVDRS